MPGLNVCPVEPVVVYVIPPAPVKLPILTKLPDESILCVPADAPVLMPVVPLRVVPVIVLEAATTPAAVTLNLLVGEEPDCRSIRLPVGDALVLEPKIMAWPDVGLPLAVTTSVELVFVPLSNFRTPEATPLLELVKV